MDELVLFNNGKLKNKTFAELSLNNGLANVLEMDNETYEEI